MPPAQIANTVAKTSEEMVLIGCRIPNGYKLEVGYQATEKQPDGKEMSRFRKLENYRVAFLKGTHHHTHEQRKRRIQVVADMEARPYINRVPKSLWEEWKRNHKFSALLTGDNPSLYEAKDEDSAEAMTIDVMSTKAILLPLDPAKKHKMGKTPEGHTRYVEMANFEEE